ncbi:hypothetical protein Sme01_23690 [Sphaerisporangium melleum]|uniref:Uncharacterized protein n=1 Tax=Sphaerisporangium melleum TaxID=321316 RepID=A0A917QS89_9ACTN|nr:hypothetical protein [Sphaerisporangium melleum]GGK65959.1 hypothetical protein GCM10007964_06250 [Sphaerisporangium melleum]GII69893.1 hypothetical protein Sme01_23690 [Sphaerisporangium melleum]
MTGEMWVREAVRNNAGWCDAVCRAHGMPGTFTETVWANPRRSPPLYPDAVTLSPDASAEEVLAAIDLVSAEPSVKDGYAQLDLSDAGFRVLFDAQWIMRPAAIEDKDAVAAENTEGAVMGSQAAAGHAVGKARAATGGVVAESRAATGDVVVWGTVGGAEELREWEGSLLGEYDGVLFPAALLGEPAVTLLAGRIEGDVVCGAALNTSGRVVGVSNVFASGCDMDAAWAGAVAMAGALFPARPMVGYEHPGDLGPALAQGFTPIGPLRIWLR